MSRCSVSELNGITALPMLKELYIAFNDIDDISDIASLDYLYVLDLEGYV